MVLYLKKIRLAVIAVALLFFGTIMIANLKTVLAVNEPASPPPGSTLEARITQRKAEQQPVIDAKLSKRLQEQCKLAQPKISRVVDKTDKLTSDRIGKYQKIDGTLLVVIGKLKLAQKDTFELEQKRSTYLNKVGVLKTNLLEFKQAMDDAVVMNCETDVAGFKALLDTARAYNARLRAQSEDVALYIIDGIKPTIDEFIAELEPKTGIN